MDPEAGRTMELAALGRPFSLGMLYDCRRDSLIPDVWMLLAPSGVSMESVDMRHTLRWRPLQAPCSTTILYSVQFQGEFEQMVLNGSWVDAPECQQIPHTHCDLTFDLGSDSDYNLHVRAQCGSQISAWSQLGRPFNRRDTVLTVPEMTVTAAGDALHVLFGQFPLTAVVSVTVWKSDNELQAAVYTVPAEQKALHIAALQEGAQYCVRAQTVLGSQLHSNSTMAHCVSIIGPHAAWKIPTAVTVTVIIVAGLLFTMFWCTVHYSVRCTHACQTFFHKEPLPPSLIFEQVLPLVVKLPETELCESVQVVLSVKSEGYRRQSVTPG